MLGDHAVRSFHQEQLKLTAYNRTAAEKRCQTDEARAARSSTRRLQLALVNTLQRVYFLMATTQSLGHFQPISIFRNS